MTDNLIEYKYKYEELKKKYTSMFNDMIEIRNQIIIEIDDDDEFLSKYVSKLSSIEKKYCIHDLKPDYSYYDPCKTIYSCSKCGYHTI